MLIEKFMNSASLTEARNYISAAGYFACIFPLLFFVTVEFNVMSGYADFILDSRIDLAAGIIMIGAGILLAILGKRHLTSGMLIAYSIVPLYWGLGITDAIVACVCGACMILVSLAVLFCASERKKYMLVILPLTFGINELQFNLVTNSFPAYAFIDLIPIVFSIYLVIAFSAEKIRIPGASVLKEDEDPEFRLIGSSLAYFFFGLTAMTWAAFRYLGVEVFSLNAINGLNLISSLLLIIISVLLFFIGKMKFTPVMFTMLATVNLMMTYAEIHSFYAIGILYVLLAAIILLRKQTRILPALMVFICAIAAFASCGLILPGTLDSATILAPLYGAVFVVAVYLAFATYSKKMMLI